MRKRIMYVYIRIDRCLYTYNRSTFDIVFFSLFHVHSDALPGLGMVANITFGNEFQVLFWCIRSLRASFYPVAESVCRKV